jgi:hypothetical protein
VTLVTHRMLMAFIFQQVVPRGGCNCSGKHAKERGREASV